MSKIMNNTHPGDAKVGAALRVDRARLRNGLSLGRRAATGGCDSDSSKGHDGNDGGFEELNCEEVKKVRMKRRVKFNGRLKNQNVPVQARYLLFWYVLSSMHKFR